MRYRTISNCQSLIQKEDNNTAISTWLIRNLCKEDKVKNIKSGSKVLVDYDDLLKYLGEETEAKYCD